MDIYIARQPIFDNNMLVYGYELLYRKSSNNYFTEMDDDQATAELIYNSTLVFGLKDLTDDTKAFINFSKELIDSDVPYLLPPQSIVVEILERGEITEKTIEACKKMKSMGYKLALDDFVFDENYLPLLDLADIVKIEFPEVDLEIQRRLINRYKSQIVFLAEKIETKEEYKQAHEMGYRLFQGYFFSKPSIINSREIEPINTNLFRIIEELNSIEPRYAVITDIIQNDLGLSYKFIKLANSVYMNNKHEIKSISQIVSYLGIKELYQWVSIMLLKDVQNSENVELIKISLIRARFMQLLSNELNMSENNSEFFFTGMFSYMDVLLNRSMDKVLEGLQLSNNVKQALLGEDNIQRHMLKCIENFETGTWDKIQEDGLIREIGAKKFMDLYMESLNWAQRLNYY
jgi:Predicted signal transduction protein containing EAL and modified HD-GYP domains